MVTNHGFNFDLPATSDFVMQDNPTQNHATLNPTQDFRVLKTIITNPFIWSNGNLQVASWIWSKSMGPKAMMSWTYASQLIKTKVVWRAANLKTLGCSRRNSANGTELTLKLLPGPGSTDHLGLVTWNGTMLGVEWGAIRIFRASPMANLWNVDVTLYGLMTLEADAGMKTTSRRLG